MKPYLPLSSWVADVVSIELSPLNVGHEESIIGSVRTKYKGVTPKSETFTCSNNYGAQSEHRKLTWTMPGLRVIYDPAGTGRCSNGGGSLAATATLVFETDALENIRQKARADKAATEPGL